MSDVDDAIRDELARLVRPADTEAVMAAVAARRVITEPSRRTSWLVAAAVIAVLGLVGLGIVSAQSEEPSITASAGGLDVPGFLPAVVPEGAELVSVHKFALDDWSTPAKPWATPGRYTLSYRDLTHPAGEPSFDLEVFPDVVLDVDAALAGLGDDSQIVRVGEAAGVRVSAPGSPMSDRIIWQVTSGTVVRIDANGIPSEEVAAIAASVRPVDEAAWAEALAGADVAPPYGFRGETAVVSGNGWSIKAGMYRQTFGLPSGCAVLELDEPDPNNPDAVDPACVSPFPVPEAARAEVLVDVHHVWVDDRLLVWGVPVEGARSVRLVYDEGTFEASLGGTGSLIRAEPIPGVDTFVFVSELEVEREPSRVEVLDGAGRIISSYEDRTSRELPARPDGSTTSPSVSASGEGLGSLQVSTSSLAPAAEAWLQHTVTITNAGDTPLYIQDFRSGQVLGANEVLVADDGCGYGSVAGSPIEVTCQMDYRPLSLDPGQSESWDVTLWNRLPGLEDVGSDSLMWRKSLIYRATPFEGPTDRDGTTGAIILTYRRFSGARPSNGEESVTTGTTTTHPVAGAPPQLQETVCGENASCASGFSIDDTGFVVSCGPIKPEFVTDEVLAIGTLAGSDTEVRGLVDIPTDVLVAVRLPGGLCSEGDLALSEWSMAIEDGSLRKPALRQAICPVTFEAFYERNGCVPVG